VYQSLITSHSISSHHQFYKEKKNFTSEPSSPHLTRCGTHQLKALLFFLVAFNHLIHLAQHLPFRTDDTSAGASAGIVVTSDGFASLVPVQVVCQPIREKQEKIAWKVVTGKTQSYLKMQKN